VTVGETAAATTKGVPARSAATINAHKGAFIVGW
jgi:hypothetical protein